MEGIWGNVLVAWELEDSPVKLSPPAGKSNHYSVVCISLNARSVFPCNRFEADLTQAQKKSVIKANRLRPNI